ncbi:hypothetical protein VTO42DRAFT_4030 [Malbranchea cinnamomea]
MSDTEDFYDDEFYDDEWFYIDDGDPSLADELAYGTTHSPVFFDDETLYDIFEESDSDWEEYDEYYDSDPSGLRKHGVDDTGQACLKRPSLQKGRPKRKRRILESTDKSGESVIVNPASFPGVVWRTPAHAETPIQLFEPDTGEKVALLKNWREIFKSSQQEIFPFAKPVNGRRSSVSPRKRGRPAKKAKVAETSAVTENETSLDSRNLMRDEDSLDTQLAPDTVPPTSLRPSPEAWKNNRKTLLSTHKRKASRLNEVMSAEDIDEDQSHAPSSTVDSKEKPVYPKVEVVVPVLKEYNTFPVLETTSQGRKRKARSPPPDPRNEESGESQVNGHKSARRSVRRKVESQTEKKESPPRTRRSLRERKKT